MSQLSLAYSQQSLTLILFTGRVFLRRTIQCNYKERVQVSYQALQISFFVKQPPLDQLTAFYLPQRKLSSPDIKGSGHYW